MVFIGMGVEHPQRMIRSCDIAAQYQIQLILIRPASGDGGNGVVGLDVYKRQHQHLIDSSVPAVRKQSLKILPFFRGGPGDAFICVYFCKLPVIMLSDIVIVIALLGCEAVELIL